MPITKKPETEEKPKEAIVQVKKVDLDYLMSEIKALREENKESKIMMTVLADKGKLAQWNQQNQGPKEEQVRLCTFDGKVVVAWTAMTEDFVGRNENGVWNEKQKFDITLEDGEKKNVSLREFDAKKSYITGIVKKRYTNEDMKSILEVDVNGKIYKVGPKFINR